MIFFAKARVYLQKFVIKIRREEMWKPKNGETGDLIL